MITSLIITFRETLEAALIVGVVLGYLSRIGKSNLRKFAWFGVLTGILVSLFGALLFTQLMGGFTGQAEKIFEGITMTIGAILIITLILWMMKQSNYIRRLEEKIDSSIQRVPRWRIFALVFVSVLREGIETVIFLGSTSLLSAENSLISAVLGIIFALILGVLLYIGAIRIDLKKFFAFTTIFLIFVAAGLIAYGIHEFQEAGVIPIIIDHIYDINPIFDENGVFGGILKGLFGYNGNPSLIEMIVYWMFLIGGGYLFLRFSNQLKGKGERKIENNQTQASEVKEKV